MGTEDRLLSTADLYMYTADRLELASRVLKAWCLIEHRVNMTLAKVMNKLLMTNLIKFVPLKLSIQNKYLYGSVRFIQ
jgi:hypothetical protein